MNDDRMRTALQDALRMVAAVQFGGPAAVQRVYDTADLPALTVALAALVDPDRAPSQLLAWAHSEPERARARREHKAGPPRPSLACGFPNYHASWTRHSKAGVECDECRQGERAYQRQRKRAQRDGEVA